MPGWLTQGLVIWQLVLAFWLALFAVRTSSTLLKLLALDTLVLTLVALLALLAISRREPAFLDIALVLAALGLAQTLAAVRLLERRRGDS